MPLQQLPIDPVLKNLSPPRLGLYCKAIFITPTAIASPISQKEPVTNQSNHDIFFFIFYSPLPALSSCTREKCGKRLAIVFRRFSRQCHNHFARIEFKRRNDLKETQDVRCNLHTRVALRSVLRYWTHVVSRGMFHLKFRLKYDKTRRFVPITGHNAK